MEFLHAIVLGIVQGITEFLPISSDGHLLLIRRVLGWQDEGLVFDAVLHLGTFLAVLVSFRTRWKKLLGSLLRKDDREHRRLLGYIFLGTIPGALAGFLGEDFIADRTRSMTVAGVGFLLSALFLFIADFLLRRRSSTDRAINLRHTLAAGFLQVVALLPGASRSGMTIAGGVFAGLSRERAVEFSFLLAAPITGGAGILGLMQSINGGNGNPLALFVGFLCAFGTGVAAIEFLLRYIQKATFRIFLLYVVGAAIVAFIFQ